VGNWNSWPNFDAWLQTAWGSGQEFWSSGPGAFMQGATNLVFGCNPAYRLDDFLAIYPKFFGLPTVVGNCGTTQGSNIVTVPSVNGLLLGQFLQCAQLPPGAVIIGIGSGQVTVSVNATASSSTATLQVYEAPPVPVAVIQLYINLAWASLQQARWQEQWLVAMGWFVAHYVTLYAQTDASETLSQLMTIIHGEQPAGTIPGTVYTLSAAPPGGALQTLTVNGVMQTPGVDYALDGLTVTFASPTPVGALIYATWPVQSQIFTPSASTGATIAAQGLAGGIQTSKSVGDVSVSYQVLESLASWGQWNLTRYGQQLASMARVVGSGPMVIW
jgi:hypothetical protein